MIEYRKIMSYEQEESDNGAVIGYTYKTAKLATPKNVLDVATFTAAFTAALELRQIADVETLMYNVETKTAEMPGNIDYVELTEYVLPVYRADVKTADYENLSSNDKRFIDNLVYAVCGIDKRRGAVKYEFNGGEQLVEVIAAAATELLEQGKIADYKPIKAALDTFCNDRLQTYGDSGLFKNFKCRFNTEMSRNVIVSAIQKYKWDRKGITRGDMKKAVNGVCVQVLLIALAATFDFDAAAKNSDKVTKEYR